MPRKLKLKDRGAPLAFPGLDPTRTPPAWMFSKAWNLLKAVARGADARNEQIVVALANDAAMLLLRWRMDELNQYLAS